VQLETPAVFTGIHHPDTLNIRCNPYPDLGRTTLKYVCLAPLRTRKKIALDSLEEVENDPDWQYEQAVAPDIMDDQDKSRDLSVELSEVIMR
jgi:hypothetical protein